MTMKGYWVIQLDIIDPDGFGPYQANLMEALRLYDGRFLIRRLRCGAAVLTLPRVHRSEGAAAGQVGRRRDCHRSLRGTSRVNA
jgi:hypothetical protein